MNGQARYILACIKAPRGSRPRTGGYANEPLGKRYGLSRHEAELICASTFLTLTACGIATLPRKPYNEKRLAAAYAR
jgi:hypothetical protein